MRRVFNPSRETSRLLGKVERIGPNAARFAQELFTRLGRPGHRALYGLSNLPRTHGCAQIEALYARLLEAEIFSYSALKHALERAAARATQSPSGPTAPSAAAVAQLNEYQQFWDLHSRTHPTEDEHGHVYH